LDSHEVPAVWGPNFKEAGAPNVESIDKTPTTFGEISVPMAIYGTFGRVFCLCVLAVQTSWKVKQFRGIEFDFFYD